MSENVFSGQSVLYSRLKFELSGRDNEETVHVFTGEDLADLVPRTSWSIAGND